MTATLHDSDFVKQNAANKTNRKYGPLMAELARKPPQNLQEFIDKADEFINQEERLRALLGADSSWASGSGEKKKEHKEAQKAPKQRLRKRFQEHD